MVLTLLDYNEDTGGTLVPGKSLGPDFEPGFIYKGISSHEDHRELVTVADHLESLRPSANTTGG